MYIAGDNDLTRNNYGDDFANEDIEQMMAGSKSLSSDCKLILYVDKRRSRGNVKDEPYFMLVEKGDTIRLETMDAETKSSDPEVLRQALQWTVDNFKAESYGLVLWGHADGWIIKNSKAVSGAPRRAYGVDFTGSSKTYMDIPDMAKVLATTPKLKFIFADCCAFQCVESAYELRNVTDYIIASPAEIPGDGAPYHTVVPAMFSKGEEFYKVIVDAYYQQKSGGYDVPLSVVKTSEMDNLAQATRQTLASFVPSLPDGGRFPDVEGLIYYYDHTQFDMQDFMLRYASDELYQQWKRVLDQTVIYKKMATVWMANHVRYSSRYSTGSFQDFEVTEERYSGLGMYVPQDASKITAAEYQPSRLTFSIDELNTTIRNMQWYTAAGLNEVGW